MLPGLPAPVRTVLKRAYHRVFHPGARIGAESFVDRRARVDRGVTIGAGSRIFAAHLAGATELGERSVVGPGCRIADTRGGANVGLDAGTEVYGSVLGENVRVQTRCHLNQVRLGRCSYIARETHLDDVAFGSFVSVGPRCLFGLGEHPAHLGTTSPMFYSSRRQCGHTFAPAAVFAERKPIRVGHDVWIGAQVFVRDGVTIGDGAIVAAGAVVTKDVAPYAIVGGVAAGLIRPRFAPDIVAQLLAVQWWHWDEPRLRAAQPWLTQPDIRAFLRWSAS